MNHTTLEKIEALLDGEVKIPASSEDAIACVNAICSESADRGDQLFQRIILSGLPSWDRLKVSSIDRQIDVALHCALHDEVYPERGSNQSVYCDFTRRQAIKRAMGIQLLRAVLPFTNGQIAALVFSSAKRSDPDYGVPAATILRAAERHCNGKAPEETVALALQFLKFRIEHLEAQLWPSKRKEQIKDRVEAILSTNFEDATPAMPSGQWANSIDGWLGRLTEKQYANWMALLIFAASAGEKTRPTQKWLNDAKSLISEIGTPAVTKQLKTWLSATIPDPHEADASLNVLKGMIFAGAVLCPEEIAPDIGRFAEVCFKKVPHVGARSVKLGNACITALSLINDLDAAIPELVRLKTRIRYSSVLTLVDRRLGELADKAGVSVADVEEGVLSDFGFGPDGVQQIELGDATATTVLEDNSAKLTWIGVDGKPRKLPPASVKREFAKGLKAVKEKVRNVNIALGVQATRLEVSWIDGRTWPIDTWRQRYVEHNLRRHTSRTLIWRIEANNGPVDVMVADGGLVDLNGNIVKPQIGATVRLWHPLNTTPEEVFAWRRRIIDAGITQPIKQAYREVYVLTDAERATQTYSNRFAAHILRQHQFRALCQARGWHYELQGPWDNFNLPCRRIPERDMGVEFHVDFVDNQEISDAYVPLHVATDRVRFHQGSAQIRLEEVPAIVFSELMRDVDLFVSVTSVANDPEWTDGGPDGRFGGYWQDYAFGDLGQTAQTRRELLVDLVPKLSIADRLKIEGNFLEVKGKRLAYRIHIGSGNIQIMPDNRYLCVIRGRTAKGLANVKLPFAGDSLLSMILSKAFMLARDDKITDRTILSQLGFENG